MRKITVAAAVLLAIVVYEIGSVSAQHAGGIAVCLAACAKSDKPCQDRCVPTRSVGDAAKSCIAGCRNQITGSDFIVEMRRCIGGCLGENTATQ